MDEPNCEAFFQGRHKYPSSYALPSGLLLIAYSGWCFWDLAQAIFEEPFDGSWGDRARVVAYCCRAVLYGAVGVFSVRVGWRKPSWDIVIDRLGCLCTFNLRTRFYPWAEIASVGLTKEDDRFHPWFILRKRGAGPGVMKTEAGMSSEEGERLLETITREVLPEHPHLEVSWNR